MLHTAKFYCRLEDQEVSGLTRKFKENTDLLSKKIDGHSPGITTALKKNTFGWSLSIYVDFIKLLGKADISEKDATITTNKINQFLTFVFGDELKEITLTRIDYRFDAVVTDKNHRQLLLKLYRKSYETHRFKKKDDRYKTSLYFNSKSINIIAYDKEEERNARLQPIEMYEKDVLRFEVRLLNRHLNYRKRSEDALAKTLKNYMTEAFWKEYMVKQMSPFFHGGNFYKINMAEKMVEDSGLKPKEKESLREFLCDISVHGFKSIQKLKKTAVSGEKMPKYTKYLIKKRLQQLNKLDINPFLIPKNTKIDLGVEKKIENPLAVIFAGV
ncbi:phage/plasmid replication domain-containing protein [Planococcus sp. CAU13]|uniref:phage/plasmid replication domain-containing protein n=1 Tax=Planococcus sp. CAU13 TaxID=1541197 RepID=UPI000530083D|nr:phage/plasmid replication protein [Planococcus sp. CAU13]